MLTKEELAEVKEKAWKATQGRWFWNVNLNARNIFLECVDGKRQYVMDFARWDFGNNCAPRFNVNGIMQRADSLTTTVEEREHHEAWYRTLDHPDANFIVAANPSTVLRLIEMVEQLQAERLEFLNRLSFIAVALENELDNDAGPVEVLAKLPVLMCKARREAFEEAARIADRHAEECKSARTKPLAVELSYYMLDGAQREAKAIAAAIRAEGEK